MINNPVPPKNDAKLYGILNNFAKNAGIIATKAKNIDHGKVILVNILSKNSDVFLPGLTPGIKPP